MSYSDEVNSKVCNTNNIVVFSDSISSFIHDVRSNFNKELKNGRARFKYFPRATSNDLTYYTDPTLEEGKFTTTVIHIGINDMLKNTSGANSLMQTILKISAKCKSNGITKLLTSNLLSTRKLTKNIIQKVNSSIFEICKEHHFYYIDNSNIYGYLLYKDVLHLLYAGK